MNGSKLESHLSAKYVGIKPETYNNFHPGRREIGIMRLSTRFMVVHGD